MSFPTLTIARAMHADAAAILDLQRLAYRSEAELYQDWSLPPLRQTLAELSDEFDSMTFLKASCEGVLIGSVRARMSASSCEIGRLIVHPDHQGRGIGRQLMYAMEAQIRAPRYELFTGARSERNIRLYEFLGYRPFKTQVLAPHLALVFMEKAGVAD